RPDHDLAVEEAHLDVLPRRSRARRECLVVIPRWIPDQIANEEHRLQVAHEYLSGRPVAHRFLEDAEPRLGGTEVERIALHDPSVGVPGDDLPLVSSHAGSSSVPGRATRPAVPDPAISTVLL